MVIKIEPVSISDISSLSESVERPVRSYTSKSSDTISNGGRQTALYHENRIGRVYTINCTT